MTYPWHYLIERQGKEMAFDLAAGQKLEIRHYCYAAGPKQIGINTVRFRIATIGPGGPVTNEAFAVAYSGAIAPFYKDLLDSSTIYAGVSVQDFPDRIFVPAWSIEGQGAGTVVGNDCPTQASGLLSLRTNIAGRKGRGRIYIPFPSVTSNSAAGLPVDDYVDDLTILGGFISSPGAIIVGGVNVNIVAVVVDDKGVGAYKDVVRTIAVRKWATQRRRGSYGRLNDLPVELQS